MIPSCDIGKPTECLKPPETAGLEININLILGDTPCPPSPPQVSGVSEECGDKDYKSLFKQLLQAVSMMDTHTDGWEAGTEDAEGALKAIDNETSRVLWGKQEDKNPMSSYQNANYGKTTANGMVMENPAVLFNKDAYGSLLDGDTDGDVDFKDKTAIKEIDKSEGFGKAVKDVIQKSGGRRDEVGKKQKGGFGDNSFGKQECESGGKGKEPELEKSEIEEEEQEK